MNDDTQNMSQNAEQSAELHIDQAVEPSAQPQDAAPKTPKAPNAKKRQVESKSKAQGEKTAKDRFKAFMLVMCRVALCAVAVFFAVYLVTLILDSDKYQKTFLERGAYISFDSDMQNAEKMTQGHYDRLYDIAENIKDCQKHSDVWQVLKQSYYNDLIYFTSSAAFTAEGKVIPRDTAGYDLIEGIANKGVEGCTEIYYNDSEKKDYVTFFVPIESDFLMGIGANVAVDDIIDLPSMHAEGTTVLMLMDKGGKIYGESTAKGFNYTAGNDLRAFISKLTVNEDVADAVGETLKNGEKSVKVFDGTESSFTLTLAPVSSFEGELWLVNLTQTDGVLSPELTYVRHIINISAAMIIALAAATVYILIVYRRKHAAESAQVSADTPEGCPSRDIFRINSAKLLQIKERKYALAVFEIRQFRYLSENISEKDMSELLEYIAKVIKALCDVRESYGYLGDGKFALLIHLESDRTLRDRVRLVESVASKNSTLGQGKTKRKFNIGISMTREDVKLSYQELLGYAEIACEKAKNNINLPYVIFNEQINTERQHNERIEAEMENALASGEFRMFLQPKYNIEADRIDSAEALVRWFDPKKGDYRFPGEFIGLFESNGFITKLDHFMYIEALKYLSAAAERFDKIVPISVNVSMVTVSAPDFLEFYVENKKKYRVGDNFITIEFTESFAMEDYQKIRQIVDTLHQNGIRCSLDDFGTGYSSLGTLKNIPFDELKFDRMFLDKGLNKQNDDIMIETMFRLASSMGIRVVQEGVETKEVFDSVVAKGCDVIQGYYYAKAIPLEEYKLFINSNTSIKYKSRVK